MIPKSGHRFSEKIMRKQKARDHAEQGCSQGGIMQIGLMRFAFAALLALFATTALAQQYPVRPVKIVVTIPPGGAPDIAARLIAQRLTETLGQPVVVENKTGANGNVAGDLV